MGKARVRGPIGSLPISYCILFFRQPQLVSKRPAFSPDGILRHYWLVRHRKSDITGYNIYSRGREASPALHGQVLR
jgi:hypothetical protein